MKKLLLLIFQLVLGIGGFALVWIFGSWQIALGVFLILWGNNMQMLSIIKEKLSDISTTSPWKRYK